MSLNRMWPLLELVGNPQDKLRVIHVAGTSGKTSTCYYAAHCLAAAGNMVGLTVSPHVDSIVERVQIDGQPISEDTFCDYLSEFLNIIADSDLHPSYFELLTVFELWVFAQERVDYAVVETGMGGLLDASNVVTRPDKVCVITDIGYDHMHILGNTLDTIAAQKAGIVHAGNAVLLHQQAAPVMSQVNDRAEKVSAGPVIYAGSVQQHDNLPLYQLRNWALALKACQYVADRDGFELSASFDPASVTVPGRMDKVKLDDGSLIIMDGAHNGQKMTAFVDSFRQQYPDTQVPIMLALKKGKEYTDVIDSLRPIIKTLVLTTFSTSQDLPAVAQDPTVIAEYARQLSISVSVLPDQAKAYAKLLHYEDEIKLVTGSFYLIGQIRLL